MTDNNLVKTIRPFIRVGGFIKSLDGNTFEGHLVRFTARDERDLQGEFFDKSTYFMQNAGYPIKGRPINYQHGMDSAFGNFPLGFYSFADEDEIGLYVRGQLNDLERYQEMLRELGRAKGVTLGEAQLRNKSETAYKAVRTLIDNIPLQQSMGADVATYRVNEDTGHIEQCGIVHGALTPTPADNKNPVVQFKSAWNYVTTLDNDRTTFVFTDHTENRTQPQTVNPSMVSPQSVNVRARGGQSLTVNDLTKTLQEHNLMARKSLKELSPEDDEYLRSLVKEIVLELSEESGMEAEEEEVLAMADEMEDQVKQADEEEIKAEGDMEEDDTTKADDMDEEEITKRVKKHFQLPTAIKKHLDKQAKLQHNRKSIASKAIKDYQETAPTTSKKSTVGGVQDNSMGGLSPNINNISVGDELKYAGVTADQMALGLKIAAAKMYPYGVPKGVKLQHFVNEGTISADYLRNMAGKAKVEMKAEQSAQLNFSANDNMMKYDRVALKSALPSGFKADELDSVSITNQGAEWAFIWYDTRLWERSRHETQLFNLLVSKGMRTADVAGKTMDVKLNTGSPTLYTAPEGRSIDATGRPETVVQTTPFTTSNVQVDVKKHMLATAFTDELDEDSIINIQSFLDQDVVQAVAEGLESALLNGDTTTTSSNINTSGTPGTGIVTPLYIAWDGIRHHVLVDNTTQGNAKAAALELADFERTIKLFSSVIRARRQNMLFVVDSDTESHTRRLSELLTIDVAGADRATIFSGKLPPIFGVDLYMSGFLGLAQADGTIHDTASNNTKGQIIAVYAPYWQFGRKRDVTIELQREPLSSATVVVASVRHILADRGSDAATMTYDLTVTS